MNRHIDIQITETGVLLRGRPLSVERAIENYPWLKKYVSHLLKKSK